MNAEQQTLPGLNTYLENVVRKSGDMEDLSQEKHYSAERLLVSHPDRYKIARALFFELGLSKRAVCDICKLNSRTLNAIIERESDTRGVKFLLERVRRRKALIAYQLTEALEDLANNPEECKKVGINGLLQAIKSIQESNGSTIDADLKEPSSSTLGKNNAPLDYEKLRNLTISNENGLDMKKNPAPREDGETIEQEDDNLRSRADNPNNHSILPSNGEYCITIVLGKSTTNVLRNKNCCQAD